MSSRAKDGGDASLSRRRFLQAGAVVLAGGGLASRGGVRAGVRAAADTSPKKGGHLVEGYLYDVSTLNPVLATGRTTNLTVNSMLYDGLLTYSAKGEILPLLAKSVPQASSNGLTYAFDLNPKARWTDGTPVTADDVVFTYQLHFAPQYSSVNSAVRSTMQTYLAKVEAAGPQRVVFTLTKPYAPFLTSYCFYGILPKSVYGSMSGEQVNTAAANSNPTVTFGQFKFKSWQKGQQITLVRNDAYYRGAPHLDTYVFRFIPDNNSLAEQLKTGEVDVGSLLPSLKASFQGQQGVSVFTFRQPQLTFCFFQMDPSKPGSKFFGDRAVRQALNYATNREGLVKAVYFGDAVVAESMLEPPTSWAYDATPKPTYTYDLKKAGKLLDQAGWTKGAGGVRTKDGQQLHFSVLVGNDKNWDADIQAMQESWRQIGVIADIQVEETAQVSAEVAIGRNFDMLLTEFGFTAVDPDPTNSITSASAASGGLNGSDYRNSEVDRLCGEAVATSNQANRKRMYRNLQSIVSADAPRLPMLSPSAIYGVTQRVRGLQSGLGPYTRYVRPFMKDLWVTDGQ